jgi:hypothetical protein
MTSPSNPAMVPTIIYEYYFASRRVNATGHQLNGRLGGYYWGYGPRVPWVTGYDR